MAGNDNIREREKIAREIEKTSQAIRKKHRALKTGKIEEDVAVKRHLGPIIEPLRKIANSSDTRVIKDESHDDVVTKIETKREQDEEQAEEENEEQAKDMRKKRKRLRMDTSLDRWSPSFKQSNHAIPITSTPHTIMPMIGAVQSTSSNLLTSEDVFETPDNSLATAARNSIETEEGQETLQNHLGPLSQKYIAGVLRGDPDIDTVYGVYFNKDEMMLGSKRFDVDINDNVLIDDVRYIGTPGLYQLIFKRMPDEIMYTDDDMQKYKSILLATNVHKRDYLQHGALRSNRGYKYTQIIKPLVSMESKKKFGKGMPRNMTLNENAIDYVHWDDPNELVDRLRLLEASRQAGNDGHGNEMLSIIEELREAGIIIN